MTEEISRARRKTRVGKVVKSGMHKSIVVQIDRTIHHARYGKTMKVSSRLYAHDENNIAGVGDRVSVMETRPLSKLKRWRLLEVIQKAPVA